MFKKEPDYHALRNFGCLAFASTLPSSRNKFSPRAVPTIFVGYPQGYKGYKLYSLDTKKFFVSKDIAPILLSNSLYGNSQARKQRDKQ